MHVRRDRICRKYRSPAALGTWDERSDRFCKVSMVFRTKLKGLNRAEMPYLRSRTAPAGTRPERTGDPLGRN